MGKDDGKSNVKVAWITGILGLLGVACTGIIGLVIAYFQLSAPPPPDTDLNVNLSITSAPPVVNPTIIVAVTNIVPTQAENTLTILNLLDEKVCYVYIVPAHSNDWGAEWLGEDFTLSKNRSIVYKIEPGNYDGIALNCQDETLEEWYDAYLHGTMTWEIDRK